MTISRPIAERVSVPSPDEVKAARVRAGLTPVEAGALVSSSAQPQRTWQKWEQEEGSMNHREMPQATWELFLLLTDQHPSLSLRQRGGHG